MRRLDSARGTSRRSRNTATRTIISRSDQTTRWDRISIGVAGRNAPEEQGRQSPHEEGAHGIENADNGGIGGRPRDARVGLLRVKKCSAIGTYPLINTSADKAVHLHTSASMA